MTIQISVNSILRASQIVFLLLTFQMCWAQSDTSHSNNSQASHKLNVFMDCDRCDMNYIRQNVEFVNYVMDRRNAQVQVNTTTQRTGSGGSQYTFIFIGLLEFKGDHDTISTTVKADATFDEQRQVKLQLLKIGLMRYVAKTPLFSKMTIDYVGEVKCAPVVEEVDKWNKWIFRIRGRGWFDGQELYKSKNLNGSISANRITKNWKIENWYNMGYRESRFQIDSATSIINSNHNFDFENITVRSVSDHWSVGVVSSFNSSTFSNVKSNIRIRPTLEYNIFKYSDFNNKQIRIQYRIGYLNYVYNDTTIFNKMNENLFRHSISVAARFNKKWGSVNFSSTGSQYLHNPGLNRLTFYGRFSWRIAKGLTLDASGNIEFIRDQISLPKEGASNVDILTRQSLLATQYSYWTSFGFTYTFGSIYNNIVNPRFGN